MNDKELLEMAAKAAGYEFLEYVVPTQSYAHRLDTTWGGAWSHVNKPEAPLGACRWNPLTDDGDALRLAVKLGIIISYSIDVTICYAKRWDIPDQVEYTTDDHGVIDNPDLLTATRLAIVRAAAEIGKSMP